jgi:hypothetical protein
MTTDYRAELQRLVQAYDEHGGKWPDAHEQALFQAVETARATLAQPEPEGVTGNQAITRALIAVSGGLCYFTADAKHAQLLTVQKILLEALRPESSRTALAQPEPEGVPDAEALMAAWDSAISKPRMGQLAEYRTWLAHALSLVWAVNRVQAQPEPEGVTARELQWPPSVAQGCHEAAAEAEPGSPMQQLLVAAGDLLENYARPATEPVPVAERLPGAEDCDGCGNCWWFRPATRDDFPFWWFGGGDNVSTHWLPHHDLPLPTTH